jgi:hypothetical protein
MFNLSRWFAKTVLKGFRPIADFATTARPSALISDAASCAEHLESGAGSLEHLRHRQY